MSTQPQDPPDSSAQTNIDAPATAGHSTGQTPNPGTTQPAQATNTPSLDDALLDSISSAPTLTLARPADPADSKAAQAQQPDEKSPIPQDSASNVRNNPPRRRKSANSKPKGKPGRPPGSKNKPKTSTPNVQGMDTQGTQADGEAFGTDSESGTLPPQFKPLARATVIRTIEARLRRKWDSASGGEFKQLVDQLAKLRGWDKEEESKDIGPPDPAYIAEWAFSDAMHRQLADHGNGALASRTVRLMLDLLELTPNELLAMLRTFNLKRKPRAFEPYEWSPTAQAPEGADSEAVEALE